MELGAAFLGTLIGSLVGAFLGAFLGYQFLRVENERLRNLGHSEQTINTLHEKVLEWMNEAAGALTRDEIEYRLRDGPEIVRLMKRLDLSSQENIAIEKLAADVPALMIEIVQAPTADERRPIVSRAIDTVSGHVAVLRRGMHERLRPRLWPFWPSRT